MSGIGRVVRGVNRRVRELATRGATAGAHALFGRARPVLFVIGAQKSGTTALYHYLGEHPQLARPSLKEINFFCSEADWARGLDAYREQLPLARPGQPALTYDASPLYMLHAQTTAPRIRQCFAQAGIVALLRDPVARAWSAWQMYRRYHARDPQWSIDLHRRLHGAAGMDEPLRRGARFGNDFLHDLEEEHAARARGERIDMPIIAFGEYARQLEPFIDAQGRNRVLVLRATELRDEPARCLARIEQLAGLTAHDWSATAFPRHFEGEYDEPIPAVAAAFLREVYAGPNEALTALTGLELPGDD